MKVRVSGRKGKVVAPSKKVRGHDLLTSKSSKPLTPLQKRARRKAVSKPLATKLEQVAKSELMRRAYQLTANGCGELMYQTDGKLHTKWCGYRWCVSCSNMRTARAWAAYGEETSTWKDAHFVTLTIPNCSLAVLRPTIQKMHKAFNYCWRAMRRKGIDPKMLRATETTWNEDEKTAHPHIHVLTSDRQQAVVLVREWLKRWPKATNAAQDIRKADAGSRYELFKYASKLMSESRDTDGSRKIVPPWVLDEIFGSIRGLRLWAGVGVRSAVAQPDEEGEMELAETTLAVKRVDEEVMWKWGRYDWVDGATGECLADYEPSDKVKLWVRKIEDAT